MSHPVRVGIVGAGRALFMRHCRDAFLDDLVLSGICDIRPHRAEQAAHKHEISRTYSSFEAMLEDKTIDLVVIGTPDHLHAGQAIQAMEAGKHVLSEIPAAYEILELERLVALEEKTGLIYAMGNEVRWFPYLEAAKKMAEEGFWGNIFHSEAGYLHNLRMEGHRLREPETDEPHWRFDPKRPQTTFLGGGPHAFDTLRWLTSEKNWVEVFAYGNVPYVQGHPELANTIALLKGASGLLSKVETSYAMTRPYCLYFNLFGDRGTFETSRQAFEGIYFTEKIPYMNRMEKLAVPYASRSGHDTSVHGSSEIHMVRDVIDAIRQDRPAAICAREAARSIAPAICAYESIRTGLPVKIPAF
ncbi:MAG: Gfo/Idh/MocA family oxidoreductase [candidate division Zixibacteria bacterium]|nr:Gfo/Idh/MocA family oxidoreductase [candidate division Zixibacteria bacterium]